MNGSTSDADCNDYYGRVKYIGNDFWISLINGEVYDCIGIEYGMLRIIDGECISRGDEAGYLYSVTEPGSLVSEGCDADMKGKWEIIDDPEGKLKMVFESVKNQPPTKKRIDEKGIVEAYQSKLFNKDMLIKDGRMQRVDVPHQKGGDYYEIYFIDSDMLLTTKDKAIALLEKVYTNSNELLHQEVTFIKEPE